MAINIGYRRKLDVPDKRLGDSYLQPLLPLTPFRLDSSADLLPITSCSSLQRTNLYQRVTLGSGHTHKIEEGIAYKK